MASISVRNTLEIILMLRLGLPEITDWLDLSDDLAGP
jgi:hypothetical protein